MYRLKAAFQYANPLCLHYNGDLYGVFLRLEDYRATSMKCEEFTFEITDENGELIAHGDKKVTKFSVILTKTLRADCVCASKKAKKRVGQIMASINGFVIAH